MFRLCSSLFIYLRTSSASPCLSPWAMDPSYTSLHIGRRSPAAAIAGFATAVMNASPPLCCCMQLSTSAPAGPLALDDCFVMAMRAAIARTRFDRATVEFENISNYTFPAFYNLYLDELIDVGDARVLTRGARRADHAAYVLSRRCARIDARRLLAAADACLPDSRFRGEDGSTRRPPSAGALRFAARMPSVRVVLRRGALRRRPCRDLFCAWRPSRLGHLSLPAK